MTFWPYNRYVLISKLSSKQLRKKFEFDSQLYGIKNQPVLNKVITNSYNTDSFECNLYDGYLTVKEKIDFKIGGYKNSFRPNAKIHFEDSDKGTSYFISMMPSIGPILFVIFAVIFIGVANATFIIRDVQSGTLNVKSFLPLFIFFVIYMIVVIGFNVDKPQLESFIFNLLEIEYED